MVDRESYNEKPQEHLNKSTEAILNSSLPTHEKRQVLMQASLLAGLVHDEVLIKRIFSEVENMINIEESSTYRLIIERGERKALSEALIRLLTIKFGELSPTYAERIQEQELTALQTLTDKIFELDKLEDLEKFLH
ncbi:DUF4351 domain-containing protein [Heliorestis convoluta]|uniref:DUF4351 domain-containing protein n=1 Tax=Heliorestis convoluta TaxID=356322 RepID=A0A5Q2N667_9FIRM|nr:DUF4351 domain-containing protein [Heliorestis convoluta]QGG48852.1 hypothetical protein FTV88_2763 [Heliorestis convoluta]